MKIIGKDQKEYQLKLKDTRVLGENERPRSQYHKKAKILIREIYHDFLCEEVYIPSWKLYLDFYLPLRKLAIEVNGQQHDSLSYLFDKSPLDFLKRKRKDKIKQQFCETNNITLIILNWNEEHLWKAKLQNV